MITILCNNYILNTPFLLTTPKWNASRENIFWYLTKLINELSIYFMGLDYWKKNDVCCCVSQNFQNTCHFYLLSNYNLAGMTATEHLTIAKYMQVTITALFPAQQCCGSPSLDTPWGRQEEGRVSMTQTPEVRWKEAANMFIVDVARTYMPPLRFSIGSWRLS